MYYDTKQTPQDILVYIFVCINIKEIEIVQDTHITKNWVVKAKWDFCFSLVNK